MSKLCVILTGDVEEGLKVSGPIELGGNTRLEATQRNGTVIELDEIPARFDKPGPGDPKQVVFYGDPFEGLRAIGPFQDPDEINADEINVLRNETWWCVRLD